MTAEGVVVWLAGLVVAPLLAGLIKQYAFKVDGKAAFTIAFLVSVVLALGVQIVYGGGLHFPADTVDLTAEVGIVLALATAAYKVLYPVILPQKAQARLLGIRNLPRAA
jgi:hypothetical protein